MLLTLIQIWINIFFFSLSTVGWRVYFYGFLVAWDFIDKVYVILYFFLHFFIAFFTNHNTLFERRQWHWLGVSLTFDQTCFSINLDRIAFLLLGAQWYDVTLRQTTVEYEISLLSIHLFMSLITVPLTNYCIKRINFN